MYMDTPYAQAPTENQDELFDAYIVQSSARKTETGMLRAGSTKKRKTLDECARIARYLKRKLSHPI